MGKPKALRSRDVIPAIETDKSTNRKKKFDDADEISQVEPESTTSTAKVASRKDAESDLPEEVSMNNNEEILKLRELHEKLAEGGLRKSKRRKAVTEKPSTQAADVALDQSIFSSLEEVAEENSSSTEEGDAEEGVGWKIDVKASKSVKIGGVEVAVLEQRAQLDPIKSFAVSGSAAKFAAAAAGSHPRVKYSTFARQKKGGPAVQFAVKC